MSNKTQTIIFICLVVIFLGVFIARKNNIGITSLFDAKGYVEENSSNTSVQSILPIPLENSNVGSALIHYFLTGKLEAVRGGKDDFEIVLVGTKDLPKLIISDSTRISKITPPYGPGNTKNIAINDLKPGLTIDISLEYDLRSKTWIMHDIYVPTDRN